MRQEITFEGLVGDRCPVFARESLKGWLDLGAYVGLKPIVLLFLPDVTNGECSAYAQAFAANRDDYRALDAVVVAVTTGQASRTEELPFAVCENARDLFEEFQAMDGEHPAAGVMIADRYGQVRMARLAPRCSELPEEARVAKLLLGFESLCPECGVPEEHWRAAVE